ncbi:hypothetical protein BG004_007581 [Podila humilis]|nr:hypothetical protein BG004_007581 [Podila humilis]
MLIGNSMQLWLLSLLVSTVAVQGELATNAPSASVLDGTHLLFDNDIDTYNNKTPVILLSKERNYQDSMEACASLGERGYSAQSSRANNLALSKLLKMTPIAETEVNDSWRYWIQNDRNGKVGKTWCHNKHPAICVNSAPRREVTPPVNEGDTSRQIKVPTDTLGTLQGHRDRDAFRFYGIPFAEPPVGENRFAAPKPLKNNGKNVLVDANKFGNACIQIPANDTFPEFVLGAKQSEDCLYLNVFTPTLKSSTKRGIPVVVYIHGGSFTSMSGTVPIFDPGNFVSRGGVVVVTINYRLGIFGQFQNQPSITKSKAPGNLATRDQIAALQWVQKNIAAFGGDPKLVTVMGESAGGWSTRSLLSAPSAFGLYKNIISQSDPIGMPFSDSTLAAEIGKRLLENLGCSGSDLACVQNKTTDQVNVAQLSAMSEARQTPGNEWIMEDAIYRPFVDGDLIPGDFEELVRNGKYNVRANILWGSVKDEFGAFISQFATKPVPESDMDAALQNIDGDTERYEELMTSPYYKLNDSDSDTVRDQFSKAATDLYWTCPYQSLSRQVAKRSKVFTYMFNHGRSYNSVLGGNITDFCLNRTCHADDIVPAFGSGDVMIDTIQTGSDARFSRMVIDRFTTFARTGNPNPGNNSRIGAAGHNRDVTRFPWSAYHGGSVESVNDVMEFNEGDSKMSRNKYKAKCDWLEKNVKYDYEVHGPAQGGKKK